jgi:hypothetical protein
MTYLRETKRIIQESSYVLKAFAAMRFSSRPEQLHFSEGDSIDDFGRKEFKNIALTRGWCRERRWSVVESHSRSW